MDQLVALEEAIIGLKRDVNLLLSNLKLWSQKSTLGQGIIPAERKMKG